MAYIKVNHRELLSVASEIDDYVKKLDNNMKQIDTTMESLQANWKGSDYTNLMAKWDEINSKNSTTSIMRNDLNSYAGIIREAVKKYRRTQESAINEAQQLCKYIKY